DEWTSIRRREGRPQAECERPAALARALDNQGSKQRELRRMLEGGNLGRERALAVLGPALWPGPLRVPVDTDWGEDRNRLRRLAAATDPATEPVLSLLALVRALQEAGHDPGAEGLLRAALRARPQEVVLQHRLGQLLAKQQRWQEAAESYAA